MHAQSIFGHCSSPILCNSGSFYYVEAWWKITFPLDFPAISFAKASIEFLCVLLYIQGPFMVQNFPQTSLQTAKTSLQTAKTSLQTSTTRLFFLFSFFATEYLFTCLFRNGCSLSGTSHSFVARAHIVRRCAPIHVISHSPYSFATWLL